MKNIYINPKFHIIMWLFRVVVYEKYSTKYVLVLKTNKLILKKKKSMKMVKICFVASFSVSKICKRL